MDSNHILDYCISWYLSSIDSFPMPEVSATALLTRIDPYFNSFFLLSLEIYIVPAFQLYISSLSSANRFHDSYMNKQQNTHFVGMRSKWTQLPPVLFHGYPYWSAGNIANSIFHVLKKHLKCAVFTIRCSKKTKMTGFQKIQINRPAFSAERFVFLRLFIQIQI